MKKILIFLLFPIFSNSQIAITQTWPLVSSSTDASAFGVSGITLKPNRLYLYITLTTGSNNFGSMSTSTTTWTNVLNHGDVTRRIQIFRYMSSSLVTGETLNINARGGGR